MLLSCPSIVSNYNIYMLKGIVGQEGVQAIYRYLFTCSMVIFFAHRSTCTIRCIVLCCGTRRAAGSWMLGTFFIFFFFFSGADWTACFESALYSCCTQRSTNVQVLIVNQLYYYSLCTIQSGNINIHRSIYSYHTWYYFVVQIVLRRLYI